MLTMYFQNNGVKMFIISGVLLTGALTTFISSSWLTIASHTYILHSLSGVIIIIYKLFTKMEVHYLEKIGSWIVVIGWTLLICDPNVQKTGNQDVSIIGEFIAIICAWFYALYFNSNKNIVNKCPGLMILMLSSFVSMILWTLIILCALNTDLSIFFSFDSHSGILGLYSKEQLLISYILGPLGVMWLGGYNLALNYFQSHIVGNATVAEPFLAQVIGCLSNQDKIPGILTFLGGSFAIPAIVVVAKGSQEAMKDSQKNKSN